VLKQLKGLLQKLLPRSSFARSVTVLVGGTAGAQLLSVIAAPVLARIYTPDDFGLLAVYSGLLLMIGVVASLRYEIAIPLPEEDQEAAHLVLLSVLLVSGMSLLTLVTVLVFQTSIAELVGVPDLADFLWLLPVGVFLLGIYNVFSYWATRTKQFSLVASTKVQQSLVTLVIQLLAFQLGGLGLLVGKVLGQGVGIISLAKPAIKLPPFLGIRRRISRSALAATADRYRRFPIFSTWEGLANSAGLQLPPILFAALYGPAAAGLYALAHRILTLPLALVGGAIGQVFYANAAEARREGRLGALVIQLYSKLAYIGLPPAVMLALTGEDLFAIVFGEQWRAAGQFAQWMTPWLYLQFVSSPISVIFFVTENQKQGLVFQSIFLAMRITAIAIGGSLGDLSLTIMLLSAFNAISYLGLIVWILLLIGLSPVKLGKPTLNSLVASLWVALPLWLGPAILPSNPITWWGMVAASSLLLAIHYGLLLRKV